MPLDYPLNPSLNQVYTISGRTWVWDGLAWSLTDVGAVGATGSTGVTGATGPEGGPTFAVTNSGASAYSILGSNNPTLNLIRGFTYYFNVTATGHPFWIKTAQVTGTGSTYDTGVTNNGTQSGVIKFQVPMNAPNTLYYICQFHGSMAGTINIADIGAQGATGATGIGATGPIGATGIQGATGAQGVAGINGGLGGVIIGNVIYPNSALAANIGGGALITVQGNGFESNLEAYLDKTACTVSNVTANVFNITAPALSSGQYHLFVYNTNGSNGVRPVGVRYAATPVWTTANGALAATSVSQSYNVQLQSTSETAVTYSIASGSLPNGITLSSSGLLSGNVTATAQTYSFVVRSTNTYNLFTDRGFSITVTSDFALEYLVVAAGGSGGGFGGGGGGGGGFRTNVPGSTSGGGAAAEPALTLLTYTPYTITIGAGGGNNSTFANITSIGGGVGGGGGGGSGG